MNSKEIAFLLVQRNTPFNLRKNLCCVENVSWGFDFDWEIDLLCLSKSKHLTEIEIKITMQDWKQDALKSKHKNRNGWGRLRNFYYALPMALALRYEEVWTREGSGIIGIDGQKCVILRKATANGKARKATDKEVMKLMRLGCMRAFKR